MSASEPVVTVYVREGCHLCQEALIGLRRMRADGARSELRAVDIEADDRLHRRYLERIPVISLDGAELYDFFLDAEDLSRRLEVRSS